MAFLTGNVNNENSKIIEEKMDEILVGRILDNDSFSKKIEFNDIIEFINRHSNNEVCLKWLQTVNNFIGLCVGFENSYTKLKNIDSYALEEQFKKFEIAFKVMNPSKINLGKIRRQLSMLFIENFEKYSDFNEDELGEAFFEATA
jgi:hypothetical protein